MFRYRAGKVFEEGFPADILTPPTMPPSVKQWRCILGKGAPEERTPSKHAPDRISV